LRGSRREKEKEKSQVTNKIPQLSPTKYTIKEQQQAKHIKREKNKNST